jgi:hypothetical protein
MAFELIVAEVRWVASVGHSGTELPPARYEIIGEFESHAQAAKALTERGLACCPAGFWYGNYAYGRIERVLGELGNFNDYQQQQH